MSSEFDFLDELLSDNNITYNLPHFPYNETAKPVEPIKEAKVKSEYEIKLRKDNARLRTRLKAYAKALDDHGSRLTQLLKEKLAAQQEERNLSECQKKLEEAKLYMQATDQLNKQLTELVKNYEKGNKDYEEKINALNVKMKGLKKSASDSQRRTDMEKKRRMKQLKILVDFAEILIKYSLLPKKYKRRHLGWRHEFAMCGECVEDSENYSEDNDEEPSTHEEEPTTLSEKIKAQSPKSLPSKGNDSSEHGISGLLEVISEDYSSGDETFKTDSGSSKGSTSTLSRVAGVNALYDQVVGISNNDLHRGDGSEIASNISSPYSLCSSADQSGNGYIDSCPSTVETLNSSLVSPSSVCCSDSYSVKVGSQEKRIPLLSEGEDWGWTGDDLSGASLISNAFVPKKMGMGDESVSSDIKPQGPEERSESTHLPKVSICEPTVFDILVEMCGRPPSLIKPLRDNIPQHGVSESSVQKEVPIQVNNSIDCGKDNGDGESIISRVDVLPASLSETNDKKSSPCDTPDDLPVEKRSTKGSLSAGNSIEKESAEKFEESSVVQKLRDSSEEVQPWRCVELPEENSCAPLENFSCSDDARKHVDPSLNLENNSNNQSHKKMPHTRGRPKKQKKLTKLMKSPKSRKIIKDSGAFSSSDDLDTSSADSTLKEDLPRVSERIPAHGLLLDDSLPQVDDTQSRDKEVMGTAFENKIKGQIQDLDSDESTARLTSCSGKISPEKSTQKGVCDREGIADKELTVHEETECRKSEEEASDGLSSVELPSESDETVNGRPLRSKGKTCRPVSQGKMHINQAEKENPKENHKMLPKKRILEIEDHPLAQRRSPRLNKDSSNKKFMDVSDRDMASPKETIHDVGDDSLRNSPECCQTRQRKTRSQWRQSLLEKIPETDEDEGKSSESSVASSNSTSGRRVRLRNLKKNQTIVEKENCSVIQTRSKDAENKQKRDKPKAIVSNSTEEGDAVSEICDKTVTVLQSSDLKRKAENANAVSKDGEYKDTLSGHRVVSGNSDDMPSSLSESYNSSHLDLGDDSSNLDNVEYSVSNSEESDGSHRNEREESPSSLESERDESSSSRSSVYAESEGTSGDTSDVPSINHKPDSTDFELTSIVKDPNPSKIIKNDTAVDQKARNLTSPKENFISSSSCSSTPLPPTKGRSNPLSISTFFSSLSNNASKESDVLANSEQIISLPCNEESCQNDNFSHTNEKSVGDAVSVSAQLSDKCKTVEDLVPQPSTISSSGVSEGDSRAGYPIPGKHLSPLKATYDSLLTQHIANENIQPKTSILVRCNYKSPPKLVRTDAVVKSSLKSLEEMLDTTGKRSVDQSITENDSKVEKSQTCVTSSSQVDNGFNFAPLSDKSPGKDLNPDRKPTCTFGNMNERKFTSKTNIPFIFGRWNAFRFPGVKFRIAGSFSSESISDPYSNPKMAIPNFGRGDFKEFYDRCRARLACAKALPDKPSGVKFVKRGAFSPPEFRDLYSIPRRPFFIMRHKRRKQSSSLTDNDAPSHARNMSSADCLEKSDFEGTFNDCSSLAIEFPVENFGNLSMKGQHSDKLNGIQLNDKTFVQAMECSKMDFGIDAKKSPPSLLKELVIGLVERKLSEAYSCLKSGLSIENNLSQVVLTEVSKNLDTASAYHKEKELLSDMTLRNVSGELHEKNIHEKSMDPEHQALGSPVNEENSEENPNDCEEIFYDCYDSLSNSSSEPPGGYPSEGYSGDGEDSPSGGGSSVDPNEVDHEREAEETSSEERANDCSADSFSITNSCGASMQVAPSCVTDLDISVTDVRKTTNEIQIEGNSTEKKDDGARSTDLLNLARSIDLGSKEKGASELECDERSVQNIVNKNEFEEGSLEEQNDKIDSANDRSLTLTECSIHEGQSSKQPDAGVKSFGNEVNSHTIGEKSSKQKNFKEVSVLAHEISTAEIEACKVDSGNVSNLAGGHDESAEVSMPSDLENLIPEDALLLDDHGIDSLMVVVNGLMAESGQDSESAIDDTCEKTDVIGSPHLSSCDELVLKNNEQEPSCASKDIGLDVAVKSDVKDNVVLDEKKSLDHDPGSESDDSESMLDLNSSHKKQKSIYRVVYSSDSENNADTEKTSSMLEPSENTVNSVELLSKETSDFHSTSPISDSKTKMSPLLSNNSTNSPSDKSSHDFTNSDKRDCNLNVDHHQKREVAGELVPLSGYDDKESCRSGMVDDDPKASTEIKEGTKAGEVKMDTGDKEEAPLSLQSVPHLSRGLAVMSSRCGNPRVTRVYGKKNVSQQIGVNRSKERKIKDSGVETKEELVKKNNLVEKGESSGSKTAVFKGSTSQKSSKSGKRSKNSVSNSSSSDSKSCNENKATKKITTRRKDLFGSDLSDASMDDGKWMDSTRGTSCEKSVGGRKGSVSPKDLFGSDFSDSSESEPVVDPTPIPKRRSKRKRVIYSSESQDESECERSAAKRAKKVQLLPLQKQKSSESDASFHDPLTMFGSPISSGELIDSLPITNKEDDRLKCGEDGVQQVSKLKGSSGELQSAALDDNIKKKISDKVGNEAVNGELNEEEGKLKASSCCTRLKKDPLNSSEDQSGRLPHVTTTPPPSVATPILDSQHTSNLTTSADLEEKTENPCSNVTLQVEDLPYFPVKDLSPGKGENENQHVTSLKKSVRRARKQNFANLKEADMEVVVSIKRSNYACSGRRPIAHVPKVIKMDNKSESKQEHNSTSMSAMSEDLKIRDLKSTDSGYSDYTPPTKKRIAHIPVVNNLGTKSSSPISECSSSCSSDTVEDIRRVTRSSVGKGCKTNASSSKNKMSKLEKLRNKIARAKGIYSSTTTSKRCPSKEGKATDTTSCGSDNKNQRSSRKCGHVLSLEHAKDQVVEATSSAKDDVVGVKRKAEVKRKRSPGQNVPSGKPKKSNIGTPTPSVAKSNFECEKLKLGSENVVKPLGDSLIANEIRSPRRDLENTGFLSKSIVDTISNSCVESEKDSGSKVSSPSEMSVDVNASNDAYPKNMNKRLSLPDAAVGILHENVLKTDKTEPVMRKRPSAKASGFRKYVFTPVKHSEKPSECTPLWEDSPGTSCESDAETVTSTNLRKKPANRKSRVGAKEIKSAGASEDNLKITVALPHPVSAKQKGPETDPAKACPPKGVKTTSFPEEEIPCSSTRMSPEELLESMEVPPLSPLSDDKLVDSLIIFPEAGTSSTDDSETNGSSTCNTADELITDGVTCKSTSKIVENSVCKAENPVDSKNFASSTSPDGQREAKHGDTNSPSVSSAPPSDADAPNDSESSASSASPVLLSEKLECLVWKREKSKDFFHNLLEEYREQFEKEKKEKKDQDALKSMPSSKKQELKNQLNRLKGQHFNNEILDDMIAFISNESNGVECKNVAKYLVRILSQEDEDDVQSPIFKYVPRMSMTQVRTLSLVMALRKRCQKFHNLIEVMLSGMSYILFRLGHAPEPEVVKTLSRMYAVFCKAIGDVKMLRVFLYDALFSLGSKAILVLHVVLSVWEQVLPKQSPERVAGHIETSIFMSIIHHSSRKCAPEEAKICVYNLKRLVKKYYKSEHHKITINDYLFSLMGNLRAGKNMNGLEAAMVLLAKKQGWDWTHRNLLCGALVSVMEEWKDEAPHRKAAVAAIRLIGLTSRSCSMETSGPVKNIIEVLISALLKEPCDDARVKEALVCSLIRLSKYCFLRVIRALDLWKPMRSPSAETMDTLKGLIKRTSTNFWRKKYRSWKKPVVNLSKLGVYFERSEPLDEGDVLSQAVEDEDFKFVDIREEEKDGCEQKRKMWRPKKNRLKHKKWLKNQKNKDWLKKEEDSWENLAWGKKSGIKKKKPEPDSVESLSFN